MENDPNREPIMELVESGFLESIVRKLSDNLKCVPVVLWKGESQQHECLN